LARESSKTTDAPRRATYAKRPDTSDAPRSPWVKGLGARGVASRSESDAPQVVSRVSKSAKRAIPCPAAAATAELRRWTLEGFVLARRLNAIKAHPQASRRRSSTKGEAMDSLPRTAGSST